MSGGMYSHTCDASPTRSVSTTIKLSAAMANEAMPKACPAEHRPSTSPLHLCVCVCVCLLWKKEEKMEKERESVCVCVVYSREENVLMSKI